MLTPIARHWVFAQRSRSLTRPQAVQEGDCSTSIECLDTSLELVLNGHRPGGVLVFDFRPEVDDEREIFERAGQKLAAAGLPDLLVTLQTACAKGESLPVAPLFAVGVGATSHQTRAQLQPC